MDLQIQSLTYQVIQEPTTKLTQLQKNLRLKFKQDQILYERSFKSIKLKTIQFISQIKETQLKILKWKTNKNLTDQMKKDILTLKNDIDTLKIQLINDIKDKVTQVRTINHTYNLCLNELIKLEILPIEEIIGIQDLPLKMLHLNYAEGLPELLIESNILSPYLRGKKFQQKQLTQNNEGINPNDKSTQTQTI